MSTDKINMQEALVLVEMVATEEAEKAKSASNRIINPFSDELKQLQAKERIAKASAQRCINMYSKWEAGKANQISEEDFAWLRLSYLRAKQSRPDAWERCLKSLK